MGCIRLLIGAMFMCIGVGLGWAVLTQLSGAVPANELGQVLLFSIFFLFVGYAIATFKPQIQTREYRMVKCSRCRGKGVTTRYGSYGNCPACEGAGVRYK